MYRLTHRFRCLFPVILFKGSFSQGAGASGRLESGEAENRQRNERHWHHDNGNQDFAQGFIPLAQGRGMVQLRFVKGSRALGAYIPVQFHRERAVGTGRAQLCPTVGTDRVLLCNRLGTLRALQVGIVPPYQQVDDEANQGGGNYCNQRPQRGVHPSAAGVPVNIYANHDGNGQQRNQNHQTKYYCSHRQGHNSPLLSVYRQ